MIPVQNIISDNGGFITTKEMTPATYRRLLRRVKEGSVVRVCPGVYSNLDALTNTMIDLVKVVPGGILNSYSAWFFHKLSTTVPASHHVAIARGRKVGVMPCPPIPLNYVSAALVHLGQTTANLGGYVVPIYDVERCVCDAVKARNKVGIDVATEVVRNYLKRPDRDIDKLMKYAQTLRVANTLSHYLEIQLQ